MVFSLPFLPLGDPQVDQYVRSKMFEHPAIVADMAAWNAIPYMSGLLPQYEVLGKGDAPLELSDWSGLRVRAGGGLGSAMEVLGATKQTLPAGETSTAFQRGALDAAAFLYTYAHASFGITEEADWFTSNLAPGTSECAWVFNKTAYEALPEQYQTLLMDLRGMGMDVEQAAYAEQDEKNLSLFSAKQCKRSSTQTHSLLNSAKKLASRFGMHGLPPTKTALMRKACLIQSLPTQMRPLPSKSQHLSTYLVRPRTLGRTCHIPLPRNDYTWHINLTLMAPSWAGCTAPLCQSKISQI
jgi:TRAP-type C4-dicarboxylate transport system substrate-binding protein